MTLQVLHLTTTVRFISEPYLHLHVTTIINKSTIKL